MNTAALVIGATFTGIMLGIICTAMVLLPRLNAAEDERDEAEHRIDNLLEWEGEFDLETLSKSEADIKAGRVRYL